MRSWLWTLLTIDVAFVVLSLLRHSAGPVASPMFALTEDGGFPEFFQYAKWAGIAAFMFAIAHIRRSRGFRVWGLFAVFLLVKQVNRLKRISGMEDAVAPPPQDVVLLQEIRDILASRQAPPPGRPE